MTTIEKARQVAAQAWCDPETSGIVMDVRLTEAVQSGRLLPAAGESL